MGARRRTARYVPRLWLPVAVPMLMMVKRLLAWRRRRQCQYQGVMLLGLRARTHLMMIYEMTRPGSTAYGVDCRLLAYLGSSLLVFSSWALRLELLRQLDCLGYRRLSRSGGACCARDGRCEGRGRSTKEARSDCAATKKAKTSSLPCTHSSSRLPEACLLPWDPCWVDTLKPCPCSNLTVWWCSW